MKRYELSYLIPANLSEEELKNLSQKINSFIQEEGILGEMNNPQKIKLSSPIKKQSQAYLIILNFDLNSDPFNLQGKLENLEKKLKSESQILRYFLMIKPPAKEISLPAKKLTPTKPIEKFVKPKPKVELKEIEKKLEEILGE